MCDVSRQATEGSYQKGFESVVLASTHMDVGEMLVFLKAFRVVPRHITAAAVKNMFSQAC